MASFLSLVGSLGFVVTFVHSFAWLILVILLPAGYGAVDEYINWLLWLSFLLIAFGLFGLGIKFASKVHLVTGVFSLFVFLISAPSVLFLSPGVQINSLYAFCLYYFSPILGIALWGASLNLVATTRISQSKSCYVASVLLLIASPSGAGLSGDPYFYFLRLLYPFLALGAVLGAYVMYKIAREK